MRRLVFLFISASVTFTASCGGRSLTADLAAGGSAAGVGGQGAEGGAQVGGASSVGGKGAGGENAGGGNASPVECISCVGLKCPGALACVSDSACRQAIACAAADCLSGGNPDPVCVLGCFNGDVAAAQQALQTVGCIVSDCASDCGGLLSSFGGIPGSTPPG